MKKKEIINEREEGWQVSYRNKNNPHLRGYICLKNYISYREYQITIGIGVLYRCAKTKCFGTCEEAIEYIESLGYTCIEK